MKQLIVFLLQFLFNGVCSNIDTAFGNHLGVDEICVLSSYTVITWITYSLYAVGVYAYRVINKYAKECFLTSMAVAGLVGIAVFLLSGQIPHLFHLTEAQYIIFSKCLKIHSLSLVGLAAGEFLNNYMLMQCKNKYLFLCDAVYYILLILSDFLCVYNKKDLPWMIACTGLCYVVYDIMLVCFTGLWKEKYSGNIAVYHDIIKYGWDIVFDRLTGKVATIVFNIYASRLGTSDYAIHSICYSLGVFTECFTNGFYFFQTVRLQKIQQKRRFRMCGAIMKKYRFFIIFCAYLCASVLLFIIHGEVAVRDCLGYAAIYCLEIVALTRYESYKAYLTIQKQTHYLKYGGIIGIFVRIPVTLFSYYCGLGLVGFALATPLDFYIRGIYFYACSFKTEKTAEKEGINL